MDYTFTDITELTVVVQKKIHCNKIKTIKHNKVGHPLSNQKGFYPNLFEF